MPIKKCDETGLFIFCPSKRVGRICGGTESEFVNSSLVYFRL